MHARFPLILSWNIAAGPIHWGEVWRHGHLPTLDCAWCCYPFTINRGRGTSKEGHSGSPGDQTFLLVVTKHFLLLTVRNNYLFQEWWLHLLNDVLLGQGAQSTLKTVINCISMVSLHVPLKVLPFVNQNLWTLRIQIFHKGFINSPSKDTLTVIPLGYQSIYSTFWGHCC